MFANLAPDLDTFLESPSDAFLISLCAFALSAAAVVESAFIPAFARFTPAS